MGICNLEVDWWKKWMCGMTFRTYAIFNRNVSEIGLSYLDRVKRIWYLSPMRAAKVQASLRIHAVSPEPPLLAHTSSESRGTFRQKARSLAPLNGWACAIKICHDGMLEDTNSLDGAHLIMTLYIEPNGSGLTHTVSSHFPGKKTTTNNKWQYHNLLHKMKIQFKHITTDYTV